MNIGRINLELTAMIAKSMALLLSSVAVTPEALKSASPTISIRTNPDQVSGSDF